jgi:cytoskeletal protein CcmA (bactofilin family)
MFKKSDKQNGANSKRDKVGAALRGVPGENGMSIIGAGMQVVGDLITDGTVRIEGRVHGTVRAGKAVVIGKEGEVEGDVVTQDAIVGGRVKGTVTAKNRLELQSTSIIDGEIRARAQHLQLDQGAHFNGHIHMIDEAGPEPLRALPAETGPQPAEV